MMFRFRSREQKAVDAFHKSPLGVRLQQHCNEHFDKGKIFGSRKQEINDILINEFYERVLGVFGAEDPFLQMRLELFAAVYCYAKFVVLIEHGVPDNMSSPYVSGRLYQHILECAPYNDELKEELWRKPESTADDLQIFAWVRGMTFLFFMNGMNLLRSEFNDVVQPQAKDWYRPFVQSMMIVAEDKYRSEIGLPTLLDDKIIRALPHHAFGKIVRDGAKNPLYEWEQSFGEHANAR